MSTAADDGVFEHRQLGHRPASSITARMAARGTLSRQERCRQIFRHILAPTRLGVTTPLDADFGRHFHDVLGAANLL